MPDISRKIDLFTDSVIARMSKVAEACGAINLAEGFPDFPPPQAMRDRLSEVAQAGPHQYSMDNGAAICARPWLTAAACSRARPSTLNGKSSSPVAGRKPHGGHDDPRRPWR